MTQPVYYDQLELDNTAHPHRILTIEQGTSTGRWKNVPYRIVVNSSFSIQGLMDRSSATGHYGQVHVGAFFTESSALARLQAQLAELSKLEKDWNGYGAEAPNARAQRSAAQVLNILNDHDHLPSRIVASADGGVSLIFLIPGGYVDIECFNEGEILAGFQLPGRPPEIEEVVLDKEFLSELSERIRHLGYA